VEGKNFQPNLTVRELLYALVWSIIHVRLLDHYLLLNAGHKCSDHDPSDNSLQCFVEITSKENVNTHNRSQSTDLISLVNQCVSSFQKVNIIARGIYEEVRQTSRLNDELSMMGGVRGATPFEAQLCSPKNTELLEQQQNRLQSSIDTCELINQFFEWMVRQE
jgi:hypothetical protein